MKRDDIEKIKEYLDRGAIIECVDIMKLVSTNQESFDLVDIKHRDYVCRVFRLSDIYEIIREFPEYNDLQKELYKYHIHTLYNQIKTKIIYKSQETNYDLCSVSPGNYIKINRILYELVGDRFLCCIKAVGFHPIYVPRESLYYIKKKIF